MSDVIVLDRRVLKNADAVYRFRDGRHVPERTDVYIQEGCISGFSGSPPPFTGSYSTEYGYPFEIKAFDLSGLILTPGIIDTHCHGGGNGYNCTEGRYDPSLGRISGGPDKDVFRNILEAHGERGTTTLFLSSLATDDEKLRNFVVAADELHGEESPGACLGGVTVEGTFLCPGDEASSGAQNKDFFHPANVSEYNRRFKGYEDVIKLVAVGLEWFNQGYDTLALVDHLTKLGIATGIGHTKADYSLIMEAVRFSDRLVFIHAGNGGWELASGLKHTNASLVEAFPVAMSQLNEVYGKVRAEQITDGVHITDRFLSYVHQVAGPDKTFAITDNIGLDVASEIRELEIAGTRAVRDRENPWALWIAGKEKRLLCGSVAGADRLLSHYSNFRTNPEGTLTQYTGETLPPVDLETALGDALKIMCSGPADFYGLSDRGRILKGQRADLVAWRMNDQYPYELTPEHVWVGGKKIK